MFFKALNFFTRGDLLLIQACADIQEKETRERELSALYEACQEFDLPEGTLINGDQEEEVFHQGLAIHCIPFWKWSIS
jgi:predicted AAA+ superfamily ATPase